MNRWVVLTGVLSMLFITSVWCNDKVQKGSGLFDMGVFAYSDKDVDNALTNFLRALEFQPNNPFYIHYIGKTYLVLDKYQKALSMLTKAYQIKSPSL